MSANVVRFPKLPGTTPVPDRQEQHHENTFRAAGVVGSIRTMAENPKARFSGRDDEIGVAQIVDQLIHQFKDERRGTHADLKNVLERRGRKMSKLDRLRVNRLLPPSEARKNAPANLIKKVQPYVYVLDGLAELLGRDPDDVLFDAFRATSLHRSTAGSTNDTTGNLTWLLQEMSRAVIRQEGLQSYFGSIQQRGVEYDSMADKMSCASLAACYQQSYEDSMDWSVTGHPLPSVPLLRCCRARFCGPLLVEDRAVAPVDWSRQRTASAVSVRRAHEEGCAQFGPGCSINAEVGIYTEIRFALGPRSRSDDLGPLFEIRSFVELLTGGKPRPLTFDLSSFPMSARNHSGVAELAGFVGSVAARFDGGWQRISGFGQTGWRLFGGSYRTNNQPGGIDADDPRGPGERDQECYGTRLDSGIIFDPLLGMSGSEWAISWRAVDRTTVDDLLHLLSRDRSTFEAPRWLCAAPRSLKLDAQYFAEGDGGYQLELAIYSGAIEQAMREECRRLKTKLDQAIGDADAKLTNRWTMLVERWRNTGAVDPNNNEGGS